VDASSAWAFVALGEPASTVAVNDATSSDGWDVAFLATSVMLNGGDAGPGGVLGHCVCQHEDATDADVLAMTAEREFEDFLAVTASDVPAEDAWQEESLSTAIDGWYAYDPVTHVVSAAPDNVWLVRTASGDAYAKLHVVAIDDATQAAAGSVTFEFAVQEEAGAPFGPTRSVALDVSGGAAYLDLEAAAAVGADDDWDLTLDGYTVRVNGGVSGDGSAGAALSGEAFDAIDDASGAPATVYAGDAFGGVFVEHAWYRYDLTGQHQIWPTFQVFLLKRGDTVYKVQLVGYYGTDGRSRQITFRYARLD
jgi:hypothetical protein